MNDEFKRLIQTAAGSRVVAARVNRDRVITSITENITESMKIGHFSIVTNANWFVEYPDMKDQLCDLGYGIEPGFATGTVKITW